MDAQITLARTGRDEDGDETSAPRVIHFCHGRQAAKLEQLLIEAGAAPP